MCTGGEFVKEYLDATVPELAFGEYWDTCEYTDGVLNYNQDAHRQRTVNWCDRTGGTSAAFDFTTKGTSAQPLLSQAISTDTASFSMQMQVSAHGWGEIDGSLRLLE